jgi:hypothetical protein
MSENIYAASSLISLPYALMVKGGSHPRNINSIQVKAIGFHKAFNIIFYIMKNKLPFNNYISFSNAARRAAGALYGNNSQEWHTTDRAFSVVGLGRKTSESLSVEPSSPLPIVATPEHHNNEERTKNNIIMYVIYSIIALVIVCLAIYWFFKRKQTKPLVQSITESVPPAISNRLTNQRQYKKRCNFSLNGHHFPLELTSAPTSIRSEDSGSSHFLISIAQDSCKVESHFPLELANGLTRSYFDVCLMEDGETIDLACTIKSGLKIGDKNIVKYEKIKLKTKKTIKIHVN